MIQWKGGAQPPKRPTLLLRMGEVRRRERTERKNESSSWMEQPKPDANTGRQKPSGTLAREAG